MKRATLRLPYVVFLLPAQLLCFVCGWRGGQLMNTISQSIVGAPPIKPLLL
jgi:hypothetical protein